MQPSPAVAGLCVLLLHLLLCSLLQTAAAATDCRSLLAEFTAYSSTEAAPYRGDNMVYFLHIPRTAGRTFHTCLLQLGTPLQRRCNKKYDQRLNGTEVEQCHMLSSHDDFSIMQQLPSDTAVVSQLRDPVQRVLSAYEFALEGAARRVQQLTKQQQLAAAQQLQQQSQAHTNLISLLPANSTGGQARAPNCTRGGGSHTKDVWPWSHLIPFLADDMVPKVAAERAKPMPPGGVWTEQRTVDGSRYYWDEVKNMSKWELTAAERKTLVPDLDPYDNDLAMPLLEFIRSSIATELLHNGELLQVLGLTNYSTWPKAAEMRSCMLQHRDIAEELLQLGLKRIERFTHVGTLDKLNSSVEAAAASLHMPLNGTIHVSPEVEAALAAAAAAQAANGTGLQASSSTARIILGKIQSLWQRILQKLLPSQIGAGDQEANSQGLAVPGAEDTSEATQLLRRRQLKAAEPLTDDGKPTVSTQNPSVDTPPVVLPTLGDAFARCAYNARRKNQLVKDNSLVHIRLNDRRQIFFDKEDRAKILEEVLAEIRALNALDVQLYERALELLERNRQQLSEAEALQELPVLHIDDGSSEDGDDEDADADGEEIDDWEEGEYGTYGFLDEYYENELLVESS